MTSEKKLPERFLSHNPPSEKKKKKTHKDMASRRTNKSGALRLRLVRKERICQG